MKKIELQAQPYLYSETKCYNFIVEIWWKEFEADYIIRSDDNNETEREFIRKWTQPELTDEEHEKLSFLLP